MDHEYELEDDYAPRVLWGRMAFFAIAILLAFLAGRCTKRVGVPTTRFNEVQAQVVDLTSENAVLQQQLEAAGASEDGGGGDGNGGGGGGNDGGDGDPEPTEEATDDGGDEEPVGDGERYTVQSGDTLTTIAQEFYGDPTQFDLIADANNLDGETPLRVGQELIIPPES